MTPVAPKYILHCTSNVRSRLRSSPNPGGGLTLGLWWSFVSLSTLRNSTSCPSVNPATWTDAGGAFSAVLAPPVFLGSDMVFHLVIVAGSVSSHPAGDVGSGVPGLAAPDSCKESSSASPNMSMLICSSVRSISCDGDVAVLSVC